MQIEERDMMINFCCIELGIVPMAGVTSNHAKATLENMSQDDRRKAIRKFRKILKKALKRMARERSDSWDIPYSILLADYIKRAGLGSGSRHISQRKLSWSQRNFRRWVVTHYVSEMLDFNT